MEFFFTIFYFVIFSLIIGKWNFFNTTNIPKHWFIFIFGIKLISSIILTSYYTNRETADIFKYFDDSKIIFDALKNHPIDYFKMLLGIDNDNEYFNTKYYNVMSYWVRPHNSDVVSDTHIIIRFNAFVRLFSFGYFHVHNVFINFLSLIGLTAIIKAFSPLLPQKEKILFYSVFFMPSVLFWGSGLLKESIIFFAFGIFFYGFFKISNAFKWYYLLFISIAVLLIIYTKIYLLIVLSIPLFGYLINRFISTKYTLLGYLISLSMFITFVFVAPKIHEDLDLVFQITTKQQTFSRFIESMPSNSSFYIPKLTSGFSIVKTLPNSLLNTLVRPYFWECNPLFLIVSALENSITFIFIFISIYFRRKLNRQHKNIFFFNFLFALLLFMLIGLTTPVFGAISRYKIPGLILLLISLLILIDIQKIKSKYPILKKIL